MKQISLKENQQPFLQNPQTPMQKQTITDAKATLMY